MRTADTVNAASRVYITLLRAMSRRGEHSDWMCCRGSHFILGRRLSR